MSLDEFKQLWVNDGKNLEDLKLNKYVINKNEEGYVNGFFATLDDNYDFYGQMSLYPEATEGWVKFIADESECGGYFEVDETKKAEIIAQREADEKEAQKEASRLESQVTYTALMTDTLIEG